MALWLVGAGKHGQGEQQFLDDDRIYLGWGDIEQDLTGLKARRELGLLLEGIFPSFS